MSTPKRDPRATEAIRHVQQIIHKVAKDAVFEVDVSRCQVRFWFNGGHEMQCTRKVDESGSHDDSHTVDTPDGTRYRISPTVFGY